MNRWGTSTTAIEELKTTGNIEILNNEDTKLYQYLLTKNKGTKDHFLELLKENGFSEFNLGIILGILLNEEGKKIKRKITLLPSFMRKQ